MNLGYPPRHPLLTTREAFLHNQLTKIAPVTRMRNVTVPSVNDLLREDATQCPYINHKMLVTVYLFVLAVYLLNYHENCIREHSEVFSLDT